MKILIAEELSQEGKLILIGSGFEIIEKYGLSKKELINALKGVSGVIIRSKTKIDREIIESVPNLKVIGRAGIGTDNIDLKAAKEKGIEVLITPNSPSVSVAELAFGMILSCARNIKKANSSLSLGKWEKNSLKGIEVFKKTLGIIGLGRIGKELAKRAKAFGMEVIFYDPMVEEYEECKKCALNELCSLADVISVHVPLMPQTENLISKDEFSVMKKTAIIINCSRGGVIDEDALYKALIKENIWGAGLDVFKEEPIKDTRLVNLPNVIATPHLGSQTFEAQEKVSKEIAENIVKFFN